MTEENNDLKFFIRHNDQFLQDKFILVFKSDEAREFFAAKLVGSRFEKVTSEMAQHAARIGINGEIVPYGYTTKLSSAERERLSTANWAETARLLAEGNERLYKAARQEK